MSEIKPDCYQCKYRGEVPGSTHSCCRHPSVKGLHSNSFGALVDVLAGKADTAIEELGIAGHPQGIRRGWFMWPADFDPTWLLECNGFKQKGV